MRDARVFAPPGYCVRVARLVRGWRTCDVAQVGVEKRVDLTPFCDAGLGRGSTAKPCEVREWTLEASRELDSMCVPSQCDPRGMLATLTLKN